MPVSIESKNATQVFIDKTFAALEQRLLSARASEELVEKAALLRMHKKRIINHAFFLLGLQPGQLLSIAQRQAFVELFETKLMHLFGGLPSFFTNGDALEVATQHELATLSPTEQQKLKNKLTARNYLRLFMRGTKAGQDDAWFWESPLASKELYDTIATKGDPGLLQAVREQIQEYLANAYAYIKTTNLTAEEEKSVNSPLQLATGQEELFRIHLQPLLLSMAFFDYQDGSEVKTPVKIRLDNGCEEWRLMPYKIKKLDLSPRREDGGFDGLIARFLRPEDRFYMYALEPVEEGGLRANPILLLNGTPPPGVPGEDLATMANFDIGKSIGGGHNLKAMNAWIAEHSAIEAFGHSKGGMGQEIVAKNPDHFTFFESLSSAGLHSTTLDELKTTKYGRDNLTWAERRAAHAVDNTINLPRIKIYHQPRDPLFHWEHFLPGTEIGHVLTSKDGAPALNAYPIPAFIAEVWQDHSFSKLGYEHVMILNGSAEKENERRIRSFLDTTKGIKNYIATIQNKTNYLLKLLNRDLTDFCLRHKKILLRALFFTTFAAATTLLVLSTFGIGVMAPLTAMLIKALPFTGTMATVASAGIITLGNVVASAAVSYLQVVPKVLKTVASLTHSVVNTVYTHVSLVASVVMLAPSAIKNTAIALYRNPEPLKKLGKYVARLQFVPDAVSGVFTGLKLLAKGVYVGAKILKWLLSPSSSAIVSQPSISVVPPSAAVVPSPSTVSTRSISRDMRFSPSSSMAEKTEPLLSATSVDEEKSFSNDSVDRQSISSTNAENLTQRRRSISR